MSEILVSTDFGGGAPAIVGFSTGFVVVWVNTFRQDINAARFDASGTKQDEFTVNTTKGIFGLPAIERTGGGGFVVTWITSSPPAQVLLQRFDDSGRKQGPETVVSANNVVTELDRIRGPVTAFLNNGNVVISWVEALPAVQVRAAIFNGFDGGREGGEFTVNTSAGIHFQPAIAAFRGLGNDDVAFVVSWTGGDQGILLSRMQLFDEKGNKIGAEIMPRHSIGQIAAAVFANNDPREFIGVTGGAGGTEEQILTSQLYLQNGTSLQTNITHVGDNTINLEPRVTALANARAVVTWTQKPVPTTGNFGNNVVAALLEVVRDSADFIQVLPGALAVNTTPAAGQNQMSAAPIEDDRSNALIAFTWVDEKIDGSQAAIKARVLSATLT
jgi:hypothetical protein